MANTTLNTLAAAPRLVRDGWNVFLGLKPEAFACRCSATDDTAMLCGRVKQAAILLILAKQKSYWLRKQLIGGEEDSFVANESCEPHVSGNLIQSTEVTEKHGGCR